MCCMQLLGKLAAHWMIYNVGEPPILRMGWIFMGGLGGWKPPSLLDYLGALVEGVERKRGQEKICCMLGKTKIPSFDVSRFAVIC